MAQAMCFSCARYCIDASNGLPAVIGPSKEGTSPALCQAPPLLPEPATPVGLGKSRSSASRGKRIDTDLSPTKPSDQQRPAGAFGLRSANQEALLAPHAALQGHQGIQRLQVGSRPGRPHAALGGVQRRSRRGAAAD